ncbi:MAG: hypothetical protein HY816_03905 [Candidatus Wallbacteria bacterium]|nr:hypothetical protein [Candidatus Wallbacteria bacterium]
MKRTVSLEDLNRARMSHLKELRLLERMTDAQFEAFRKNFSLPLVDPEITRTKAIETLRSMLATNIALQKAPGP